MNDIEKVINELKDMYEAAEKWRQEASDDIVKARADSCIATLIEMKLRIEKLPSEQPEIVRCKDCILHGVCTYERGLGANGFCSDGERRENEN